MTLKGDVWNAKTIFFTIDGGVKPSARLVRDSPAR